MMPLRRHRLAFLSDAGWAGVRARAWDAQAQACIDHWAAHRLPLVVTRQPADASGDRPIALGLPAPLQWDRRRLAVQVPRNALAWFDEFPRFGDAAGLLPRIPRAAWRMLGRQLAACDASARIYGAYGWQLLTGLPYVRESSDIDLWIGVRDAEQADTVAHHLERFAPRHPRLDGELVFEDGTAVAWREWHAWRAGRARHLLVKRLHGASMADASFVRRYAPALEMAA
ncbi:phosphoribosyl-dephospho-CoA transferase [Variovorax sp. HW608]|uniref:malonate decarboxylase holo-[acyl-carrier-protein] synthase n=1 Tax=Variovorax sp. HW608 TaxID=1034889 RepID=UPI00081FE620|nr:malonate decarboxylase holo-[acyl-carrier-protein] synthase [Variovorax sp. HW608]SCK41068.1 phosphoribosyl-dephospho-CoA transferase [Variovorax sp. HW608]